MDASSDSLTYYVYPTPAGRVTLQSDGHALTRLVFGAAALEGRERPTALTNRAASELQEYFAGRRTSFDVALHPSGTAFQRTVWDALSAIPYGETRTYAQIAEAIGRPTATRAVGGANNRNPLPIFIPCHRVVGANGNLVGYAAGLKIKAYLLDLESRACGAAAPGGGGVE